MALLVQKLVASFDRVHQSLDLVADVYSFAVHDELLPQ